VAGIIDISVNFLFPTSFLASFGKPSRAGEVLSKILLIVLFFFFCRAGSTEEEEKRGGEDPRPPRYVIDGLRAEICGCVGLPAVSCGCRPSCRLFLQVLGNLPVQGRFCRKFYLWYCFSSFAEQELPEGVRRTQRTR
jgi:hypothetical protein